MHQMHSQSLFVIANNLENQIYDCFIKWENNKKNATKRLANEVKIETYFAFFTPLSEEPFIKRINIEPTRGRKVIADNIGKPERSS